MAAHVIPGGERFVPLEEYLRTGYHPDRDYVDGRVEERNVGEYEHASVQKMLLRLIGNREAEWGINVIQECRLQVSEQRFRVPDVMVLRADQKVHRIVREAPLVCIEIVSPEDTWKRLQSVMSDYLAMGVQHIWAFDPETRSAHRFDAEGFHRVTSDALIVDGTEIHVVVNEVFSLLD